MRLLFSSVVVVGGAAGSAAAVLSQPGPAGAGVLHAPEQLSCFQDGITGADIGGMMRRLAGFAISTGGAVCVIGPVTSGAGADTVAVGLRSRHDLPLHDRLDHPDLHPVPRSPRSSSSAAAARFAFVAQRVGLAVAAFHHFALINPNLDADHAISRIRLAETVIDIGTQRVQRQLALQIPFATRDFGAIQAARYANLDSFATETQR